MTYKIILATSAFEDLESIKKYISLDNPLAAKDYVGRIIEKFETLKSCPQIGTKIENSVFDFADVLFFPSLNHIVIYKIDNLTKAIFIVGILSRFQDWKNIIFKNIINKSKVIIENEELSIKRFNTSMFYDVWMNSQDKNNRKYVPDEVFETIEEAYDVVNQLIESYKSEEGPFVYPVFRKIDNTNLGYVQLIKIKDGWEVGYHIAEQYTNKGYASKALKLFIEHIKNATNIKEIYGIALAKNKASLCVLEKNGFETVFKGLAKYQGKNRIIVKTIKYLDD